MLLFIAVLMYFFQNIISGDSKVVLTGGVDNMSQAPHAVRGIRFGTPLGGKLELEDTLWVGLTDTYCGLPMALTAEKLAEQYKVTRAEVDEYALRSQNLWKKGEKIKISIKISVFILNILLLTV